MQIELLKQTQTAQASNLLPSDGGAEYLQEIFDQSQCANLFQILSQTVDWQPDQLWMFGKKITTSRKVAWVGDDGCSYTYSGVKKSPQPWTPELLMIKNKAEELARFKFNSCLLNLYHNGNEGMGWHSDDEVELDENAPIVSISFGASRKFAFRHKLNGMSVRLFLENGSALVMHSPSQKFWNHSLLKTKLPVGPRINLTFRKIKAEYES